MNKILLRGAAALAPTIGLAACVVAPPVARATLPPPDAAAATICFYLERGQDTGRQDRDRYECCRWAVGQSGFDPGMTPVSLPPPAPQQPAPPDGSDVAAGAVTGAVIGSVASSRRRSGEGAAIGAIFGTALGAIAQEARAQAIEQANVAPEQEDKAARQAALAPLAMTVRRHDD